MHLLTSTFQTGIGDGEFNLLKKGFSARTGVEFNGILRSQLIQATSSGHALDIESPLSGLSITSDSQHDGLETAIKFTQERLEVQSPRFVVRTTGRTSNGNGFADRRENNILFEVSPDQVTTSSKGSKFVAPTLGGQRISESLETSLIEGDLNLNLR